MVALLDAFHFPSPLAIGHRFVSGGPKYIDPQPVDDAFREDIRNYFPFAPLHLPIAVMGLDALIEHFPQVPQVVCFDTAFHQNIPEVAARLPLPRSLWNEGVRKYGFHGLSYEYIVSQLPASPDDRVVVAHLGNGASLAAIQNGRSIDTTMGLTPTGGILMGTRSGDMDPGVMLYLMNEKGYDSQRLEQLLNNRAGMLAISEITSDMQDLLDADDVRADLAVHMFAYAVRKAIAAMAGSLGGIDTLVFTGGIGEHAPAVRDLICRPLDFLSVTLDPEANAKSSPIISNDRSRVRVLVIPTDEDVMIARHTFELLTAHGTPKTTSAADDARPL
jgi:acetate kinase